MVRTVRREMGWQKVEVDGSRGGGSPAVGEDGQIRPITLPTCASLDSPKSVRERGTPGRAELGGGVAVARRGTAMARRRWLGALRRWRGARAGEGEMR
jgi:hypothetical protein